MFDPALNQALQVGLVNLWIDGPIEIYFKQYCFKFFYLIDIILDKIF